MKVKRLILTTTACVLSLFLFSSNAFAENPSRSTFGNHNLNGIYSFRADGAIEVDGIHARGMWEVGRFEADGHGNMTNGVEYSSMLSADDESIIDIPYTFSGTYEIDENGMGKGEVAVYVPAAGITILKKLWFVVFDLDSRNIAHGFAHGHADAELGPGIHGNARTHVGRRMASLPARPNPD